MNAPFFLCPMKNVKYIIFNAHFRLLCNNCMYAHVIIYNNKQERNKKGYDRIH